MVRIPTFSVYIDEESSRKVKGGSHMDDSKIITLYRERDERAITASAEKYGAYCFAIAQNILKNSEDSEECVNDTWLKTWNVIPPQMPRCLRAFLGKITRCLAFDKYRATTCEKRGGTNIDEALDTLIEVLPETSDAESEYEAKLLGEALNRFLAELPKRERDIFLCRYYFLYSISEIAKKHGMRENYVRNLLSRTKKKLKTYLEKEDFVL